MPPRGVSKSSKRGRQYEHIKESERKRGGTSARRAEEIAARTVNKERSKKGETRSSGKKKQLRVEQVHHRRPVHREQLVVGVLRERPRLSR